MGMHALTPSHPGRTFSIEERKPLSLVPLLTFLIWVSCVAISLAGIFFSYQRPIPASPAVPPIQAELVQGELARIPIQDPVSRKSVALLPAPPQVNPIAMPQTPPRVNVLQPDPS